MLGWCRRHGEVPCQTARGVAYAGKLFTALRIRSRRKAAEASGDGEGSPSLPILSQNSSPRSWRPDALVVPTEKAPSRDVLSLFHARFLFAHGHFIAAPDELIGAPGIDVDDRQHQVAQKEKQRHAPGEMPPVESARAAFREHTRRARRRTVAAATFTSSVEGDIGRREAGQSGAGKNFRRVKQRKGFPPRPCPARLAQPDVARRCEHRAAARRGCRRD